MPECPDCGSALPADARFCAFCGRPAASGPVVEERKLATALFADLVGSTALGAGQDPERSRAMLERFYDAMQVEIEDAGGTVEKFIGDAVVAAFGAPSALEDHAERAVHAALAMQRRMRELFGDRLSLRIGVETGEVVVGRPREGSSFVTGDSVNVAARLEQAAAPGEILVGVRAAAIVGSAFDFGPQRLVEAKGKDDGVLGAPVARALSLMRPRGVAGLASVFVGRESELELLLNTYGRVVEQESPHLVTVAGDAGVGKSRLIRELWERLADADPAPLRRTGRCLAYGHGITYWPLGEILKEQLDLRESDSPETLRSRLGGREILALALGGEPPAAIHPLTARELLHDAVVELFEELASERPLVVLVEDLHWAEEPLLDLIERLLRDVKGPLLLLCTARPELLDKSATWGGGLRNATQLWLEPLRAEQAAALVDSLVGPTLPRALHTTVLDRADGNPFFIEELLGTLLDAGVLARHDEPRPEQELDPAVELPATVHAVVAARMDLLPAAEKATLQAVAVAGRTFWESAVGALLPGSEPDYELLEKRDFIRRRPTSTFEDEREFVIKHAVTREVAYASLPKARRARLHAAFADWLLARGGGRDEHAPLLAHHYAEAAPPDDLDLAWPDQPEEVSRLQAAASRWLRRAGALAVARYDLDEGIALLHRAVEFEGNELVRAELWREIGRANALGFHGGEFLAAMERSLDGRTSDAVRGETYAELAYQTSFRRGMWNTAPDPELFEAWFEQALELTEPETEARCKALIAGVFWDRSADLDSAREASAIAERIGNPELRASAFNAVASAAHSAGQFEDALEWAERSLAFIEDLGDPEQVVEVYESIIPPTTILGRFDAARSLSVKHQEAARRLTPHHQLHGIAVRVEIEELCANWEAISADTAAVERAVSANLTTPCVRNQRTLLVCAAAHRALGAAAEANRLEEKAEALDMQGYEPQLSGPRLQLALLKDDFVALARLTDAIGPGDLRELHWPYIAAHVGLLDGLIRLDATDAIERAAAPLVAHGHTYVEPFALRALGYARGDRRLIDQAVARFNDLGLGWHADRTAALVGER